MKAYTQADILAGKVSTLVKKACEKNTTHCRLVKKETLPLFPQITRKYIKLIDRPLQRLKKREVK